MSREAMLIHYNTAMAVFQSWRDRGAITTGELSQLESILAEKYGLSLYSIYRHNPLI